MSDQKNSNTPSGISRGALAKQLHCNAETIRYYEKSGLLPEPARAANGYRQYSDDHVRRLRFILKARGLGFSGDSIRGLLEISDVADAHTRAEVKALTQDHIGEISKKIEDLEKLRSRLEQISSHCDGSSKSAAGCPIMITLFDDKH